MSVAMLPSVSASFYQWAGAMPVPPTSAVSGTSSSPTAPVRRHDHDDDDRPKMRENTLVSAMMAAFRALGIGQAPAGVPTSPAAGVPTAANPPATKPVTPPLTAPSTAVAASTAAVAPPTAATAADTSAAATAATSATSSTPASPDTLEKAVNEFAHALFSLLRRQGRNEHSDGEHDGGHGHRNEDRHGRGYSSFVQRLEQLAQSLTTPPPAASGAASATVASAAAASLPAQTAAAPATSTTPALPASGSEPVSPAPSRGVTRLLAAFSKVMGFLQPVPAATATPSVPTTPATTAASTADKLKLFLTTLAQSLSAGTGATQPSPVGSRINVTV